MARRPIKGEAIVLYGAGSLIVAFLLLPLVLPFVLSVSDTPFVVFPPRGFTLQWYGKVLADPDFTGSFGFSVVLSLCAACGAVVLGVPTAVGLVRLRFNGRRLIQALVLSSLIFPTLVTGIAAIAALMILFSLVMAKPDAIVTWCTNFPAAYAVAAIEARLGIPVYDSVTLGVWHGLEAVGALDGRGGRWGSLFAVRRGEAGR